MESGNRNLENGIWNGSFRLPYTLGSDASTVGALKACAILGTPLFQTCHTHFCYNIPLGVISPGQRSYRLRNI